MLSIVLLIIIILILTSIFCIAREIGKSPSDNDLFKYTHLSYFKNGRFYNIYRPISKYKNLSPYEEQSFNFFNVFFNTAKFYENQTKTETLNKDDFSNVSDDFTIYWLGHATTIFELANKRIIVDPIFDNCAPIPFFMKRYSKLALQRKNLPKIDYVLITHNHYDHLERKTVKFLYKKYNSIFIVPLGVKITLQGFGVKGENIIELGWYEKFNDDNITFCAEPAMHFSQRSLFNGNKTLWMSYVIQFNINNTTKQIFVAGDGGYGEHFYEISNKYKHFDLITAEIDAWNSHWPFVHLFPAEVIELLKLTNADYLLPVHHGVYPLGMHKDGVSLKMLNQLANEQNLTNKILLPNIGEKITLK